MNKYVLTLVIYTFAILLVGCDKPERSLLCDEPLISKEELKTLKDLNSTLGKLVVGLKKNICFKETEDGKTNYFKIVFNVENRYDKYNAYYRSEIHAIDSMKVSYAWQDTYSNLDRLFQDGTMIDCKDVPK